jgi:predicted acyltransferase
MSGASADAAEFLGTAAAPPRIVPVPKRASGVGARPRPTDRPVPMARRLVSLDVFRGIVIAGMLLVNNMVWTASTPRQLMHAPWGQGITFTDLILPWFVFIMGVTIPVSAARSRTRPAGGVGYMVRIARRVTLLLLLGILMDSVEYSRVVIGMDVLQLLALTYLVTAVLSSTMVWARLAAAAVLLGGHWALLRFVPVPGYGPGVLQESHNIVRYLNAVYLARYHLAGVLSVVPAAGLALVGTAAGDLIRARRVPDTVKAGILTTTGAVLWAAGAVWARDLPLNKALWTSSYAVVAAGTALLLLGCCYPLCERRWMRMAGYPFAALGSNAIAAYVASGFFAIVVTMKWHIASPMGATAPLAVIALLEIVGRYVGAFWAGWIYTAGVIVMWWLLFLHLYRKRVFLRV